MMKIGHILRTQRRKQNLTQREVAEAVDCGLPHYTKIETGKAHPSIELLEKILQFLNTDLSQLIEFETDPGRQKLITALNLVAREIGKEDLKLLVALAKTIQNHSDLAQSA